MSLAVPPATEKRLWSWDVKCHYRAPGEADWRTLRRAIFFDVRRRP